jgi:DNA-binding NarL/FixJ family response regulator
VTGVFLIGGSRLFREAVECAFLRLDGPTILGTAATLDAALLFIADLAPAAVLLQPVHSEPAAVAGLFATLDTRLVIIGVDETAAVPWIEAGAAGYIHAETSLGEVVKTVQAALRDELVCSPLVASLLAARVRELSEAEARGRAAERLLTPREREIVRLVSAGRSDKEIALELVISARTVKNHVHSILAKLGVSNRLQAAAAVQRGLVPR